MDDPSVARNIDVEKIGKLARLIFATVFGLPGIYSTCAAAWLTRNNTAIRTAMPFVTC